MISFTVFVPNLHAQSSKNSARCARTLNLIQGELSNGMKNSPLAAGLLWAWADTAIVTANHRAAAAIAMTNHSSYPAIVTSPTPRTHHFLLLCVHTLLRAESVVHSGAASGPIALSLKVAQTPHHGLAFHPPR
jgi:hypothetical protein